MLASASSQHFAPVNTTVARIVNRCRQIDWLRDVSDQTESEDLVVLVSPVSDSDVAKRLLGMSNVEANLSRLSLLDVTADVEKEDKKQRPLVPPRRRGNKTKSLEVPIPMPANGAIKVKPMIPKPRRSKMEHSRDQSPFTDAAAD